MKTVIRSLVGACAVVALAGCAGLAGAVAPMVPGMSAAPGVPGASAAPATTASTTPTTPASTASTTPTTPAASKDPIDMTAADCKLTAPAKPAEKGEADLGAFENQNLPNGYNAAYSSEAEVYEAIGKLDTDNWACFQKFYPGASGLYKKYRGWS